MMQRDLLVDDFTNLGISEVTSSNDVQEDASRKLFVGGLSWMTSEDGLRHYFESLNLGVERVTIMCDKTTGRSRGFGFVLLATSLDVDKAVIANLFLDGRKVEAKRAIPKREMDNHAKKIFVGGIPISLSTTEFRKYFEGFGAVLECQVMTDRESGRSRGFGFVTYEDESVVDKILKMGHTIHGKPVEVKRAEPKKQEHPQPVQIMHVNPVPVRTYVPHTYPYPGGMYAPQAVYGAPVAYDPAYFVPQGGFVYLPQHYDLADPEFFSEHPHMAHAHPGAYNMPDLYDPKYEAPAPRRGTSSGTVKSLNTDNRAKVPAKPVLGMGVVQPRRLVYPAPSLEPQETTFAVPGVPYPRKLEPYGINMSSLPEVRLSEPRSERAFTTGILPEGLAPIGSYDFLAPGRTRITTPSHLDPRKKRAGTQPLNRRGTHPGPTTSTSEGAAIGRRTDLNWRNNIAGPIRKAPGSEMSGLSGGTHKYFQ